MSIQDISLRSECLILELPRSLASSVLHATSINVDQYFLKLLDKVQQICRDFPLRVPGLKDKIISKVKALSNHCQDVYVNAAATPKSLFRPQHNPEIPAILKTRTLQPDFWSDVKHSIKAYKRIEDTGGQPEFMDMLPALTIGPGLYWLFFSYQMNLKSEFMVIYQSGSGESTVPEQSTFRVKEVLLSALSSISCSNISDNLEETSSSDMLKILESSRSVAYIVGTHKDKVSEEDLTSFDEDLRRITKKNVVQYCSESMIDISMDKMGKGVDITFNNISLACAEKFAGQFVLTDLIGATLGASGDLIKPLKPEFLHEIAYTFATQQSTNSPGVEDENVYIMPCVLQSTSNCLPFIIAKHEPLHKVCDQVSKELESTLEKVSSHMNYGHFMDYQLAFKCPSHSWRDYFHGQLCCCYPEQQLWNTLKYTSNSIYRESLTEKYNFFYKLLQNGLEHIAEYSLLWTNSQHRCTIKLLQHLLTTQTTDSHTASSENTKVKKNHKIYDKLKYSLPDIVSPLPLDSFASHLDEEIKKYERSQNEVAPNFYDQVTWSTPTITIAREQSICVHNRARKLQHICIVPSNNIASHSVPPVSPNTPVSEDFDLFKHLFRYPRRICKFNLNGIELKFVFDIYNQGCCDDQESISKKFFNESVYQLTEPITVEPCLVVLTNFSGIFRAKKDKYKLFIAQENNRLILSGNKDSDFVSKQFSRSGYDSPHQELLQQYNEIRSTQDAGAGSSSSSWGALVAAVVIEGMVGACSSFASALRGRRWKLSCFAEEFCDVTSTSPAILVSWLGSLLLQCNDVETNPGPTKIQLTLPNVMDATASLVDWFKLGVLLKIPLSSIEDIAASCKNVMEAKGRMLSLWLNSDPDASWEKLADAVRKIGYAQLSQEIWKKYSNAAGEDKARISSTPRPADLFSIPDIDSRWMEIGTMLSIKMEMLDAIGKKYHKNVVRCKREMFKEALKQKFTWKDLLDAFSKLHLEVVVKTVRATMEFEEDRGGEEKLTSLGRIPPSATTAVATKGSLTTLHSPRSSIEARSDPSLPLSPSHSDRHRPHSPRLLQSLGPTHPTEITPTSSSAYSDSSSTHSEISVKSSTQPLASSQIHQDQSQASLPAPHTSVASTFNRTPSTSSLTSLYSSVQSSSSSERTQSVASSLPPQPGLKVFKQHHNYILKELSKPSISSSIVFANKVHSLNLITRNHIYELRAITSNEERVSKLLEYLEESIRSSHKNFELFIACLKSTKDHVALAEALSRGHYLQLVLRNMQKISTTELNLNAFCHTLNDHKLISDGTKRLAMSCQDSHGFCSAIYNELKPTQLGEDFLDILRQFENTRSTCAELDEGSRSSGFSSEVSTDIPLLTVTDDTQDLQSSTELEVREKKDNHDVESDTFMSAESSLRERSVDVFHDSISDGSSAASARKDFLNHRQRLESDGSSGYGVESQVGEEKPHEVQELGSGGSTPKNHSARPAAEHLHTGDEEGPVLSREQLHFHKLQELDPSILQRQREKEAEFVVAVKKWNMRTVQSLLQEGVVAVDHRFEKSRTALMLAAIDNQKEATQLFIKHKASVTAVDIKGYTPLYLSAKYGNYELLRIILEEPEVDINVKSKLGVPVLIRTSQKGFSVVTEHLLEHGALPDLPSEQDGLTALYAAIMNQQKDVVKILLEHNADVTHIYTKTERTPLEEAVEGEDPEIVSLIMKAEAKTKAKSKQLFTAKTPDEIKDLVIRYNAKIDCRNSAGATPLIAHTISGHLDIVKKLIQLKSNIDLQDSLGYSALIVSCKAGHIDLVRLLIASGAILDLKERNNGYTGLMFAIVNVHVPVVKELVLAKANINLRNRDHKSALDLAKEGNNADIMEVVKVQSGSSSGRDDPFVQLLSTYMNNKAANPRLSAAKAQSPTKSLKSRPDSGKALSLKTYKAPLTSVTPDEPSSTKAELEKSYKRIADLEIRVHDLSTATSMDLSKDEDVSYMDKSRLETEFKKLRAAKKKAEQYAVEAKQTAQRLSAENFKLREDLNKERHFNELTRKTIVKEVEREVELNAKREKLELVRRSVFQEEVAERAYQLVQNDPNRGTIYQKVLFSGAQLKDIIMTVSIRINMFHVVVDGLPDAGKSTLCHKMGVATEAQLPSRPGPVHGVDLYEAALGHSTLNNPDNQWVNFSELKGRDGTQMDMLALGLLYFLVSQHRVPRFDSLTEIDSTLFDDVEVQEYFVEMCKFLQKISTRFTTEKGALEKLLTGPLSLVNIFSIYESKPMREILQAISGQHPNVLLLDLINISKYDRESLPKGEDNRYYGSPLHHLVACIEVVSHEEPASHRCIVVGTHKDKLSKEKVEKQKQDIMKLVKTYASDIGVPAGVVKPEMMAINTKSIEDCKNVTALIVDLIDQNKQVFEVDIPLSFLFFRWYLHKTKEKFVTRAELVKRARKCGIDDREIDKFLAIFRACGSIISTELEHEFFHDHFILLPIDFFRELYKLFTMKEDGTIPREYLASTRYGVVSDRTLRSLWQGQAGDISVSDFYIKAMDNFGILANLGNDEYYIPSLKADYDMPKAPDADSLIITTDSSYFPLRKQVEFVKYFRTKKELNDKFKFLQELSPSCRNYSNVTYFKEMKNHSPVIRVRFLLQHIEFSVLDKSFKEPKTYSLLKTALVDIMNIVGSRSKSFRFQFNIPCPNTKAKPKSHFIQFEILDTSVEDIKCPKCGLKLNPKDKKLENRLLWIQAAFVGTPQSVIHPEDVLNPRTIQSICKELIKKSTFSSLIKISKRLSASCFPAEESPNPLELDQFSKKHRNMDDVLFHSIYAWHCYNVAASKVTLAKKLIEWGYYNEAFVIEPSLYQKPIVKERETTISPQKVLALADWWPTEPVDLGKILKLKLPKDDPAKTATDQCIALLNMWVKDNSGGDQQKRLFELLEQNQYYPPMENFLV